MTIQEMLDQLSEIRAQLDTLESEKQKVIATILTPEIKAQIESVEFEFAGKSQAARENAGEIEKQIKDSVLRDGKSAKGKQLIAVYAKGRVSWDTSKLDGLMLALPQLKELRSEGAPSVSIRASKS